MFNKSCIPLTLVAFSGFLAQAAIVTIDNFNTGAVYLKGAANGQPTPFTSCWYQNVSSNNSACSSQNFGGAAVNMPAGNDSMSCKDTILNSRYTQLTTTQYNSTSSNSAKMNINGDIAGAFNLSTDAQTTANAFLKWDGGVLNTATVGFGLGADLVTASSNDAFLLKYQTDNAGLFPPTTTILISVYTSATNFSTYSFTVPATGFQSGFRDFYATFSNFVAAGTGGGVNWNLVNAITMNINAPPGSASGLDFVLDSFQAVSVPEPSTYLFVAAGLVGLCGLRRKQ